MSITAETPETDGREQRIPLSYNQQFLRAFDKGETDGAFGHRHTLVGGWRVSGAIDTGALQRALDDMVERHEVLRTEVAGDDAGGHQIVHPSAAVALQVTDLPQTDGVSRELHAQEFLNDLDAAPYPVRELPHLRAHLARFDDTDAVLVLATHHTSTDAWSLQVLIRDLVAAYRAHAAGNAPDLGKVCQYREFALYQQQNTDNDRTNRARAYWRECLAGAEITGITSDRAHQEGLPSTYGVHRFAFDAELSRTVVQFARAQRCTPFMVLAAIYSVLLRRRTGTTDIVFPTFSSGRYEERFEDSVGPFFNFVPIRIDTSNCTTLADVLDQSRAACVGAYHNEIPFTRIAEDGPALLAPFADGSLSVVAFEVLQSAFTLDNSDTGGPRFTEIRHRTLSQQASSAIPNGGLWAMDVLPGGELVGSLKFDYNRFDEDTARELVAEFCRLLTALSSAPQTSLAEL